MNSSILKAGFLSSLLFILMNLMSSVFHITQGLISFFLTVVLLAAVVIIVLKIIEEFKNNNEGFISFGKAFIISFGILMIAVFISSVYTLIQDLYIFPDNYEIAKLTALEKAEEMGYEGQQYALMEKIYDIMFRPGLIFFMKLIGGAFFYAIVSLIIAAVKRHEDVNKILQ